MSFPTPTSRRQWLAALALAALSPRAALAASAPAVTMPPLPLRDRTLANGLRVISIPDRLTATAAVQVWYRVGSKDDPEGRSGFAHLFEHLMFKGTRQMPPEMFDRLTRTSAASTTPSPPTTPPPTRARCRRTTWSGCSGPRPSAWPR